VYRADQDEDNLRELYRVDIATPGISEKIISPLPEYSPCVTGDVFSFIIRDDDQEIAYRADQETNEIIELYEVDVDNPGVSTKVNPAIAGNDVFPFQYSAEGSRFLYVADEGAAGGTELYLVETASLGTSTRISSALVNGGDVIDFRSPK
jgi:hypothetical protein